MNIMTSRTQASVGKFLVYALILNTLLGLSGGLSLARAQKRVIVINAEQPNVWTLEQAHYLLAQMHRRNLDLKAKSLQELDPNEINGLRFDVMRMLIEFGATFNQADLATNKLISRTQEFNSNRREELLAERDRLRKESVSLTGEIEELKIRKADAKEDEEKAKLDDKIVAKTARLAKVDKEIEFVSSELETLTVPSGQPKVTAGSAQFDPNKLPKSIFDEAFEAAAATQIQKFNDAPQLNASLRLDNFLQMQYEIIAKQLTLLRDEVGPGERLLFLEMPQSINAAHHESEKKWAQSWWKIAGYTKRVQTSAPVAFQSPTPKADENNRPITTADDLNSIIRGDTLTVRLAPTRTPTPTPTPCPAPFNYTSAEGFTISAAGPSRDQADHYPSTITVAGLAGTVKKLTVTLNSLSHSSPGDLDVLLVGPDGQTAILISDVGGRVPASNLSLTLDTKASHPLLDSGPLVSGTFKPTDSGAVPDSFPAPAPTGPYGTTLSVFEGIDPNGPWSLYVVDDHRGNGGSIGGWNLEITTACTPQKTTRRAELVSYKDEFFNLDDIDSTKMDPKLRAYLEKDHLENSHLVDRMVRTVELIPRQSSLNVNDMKLQTRAGAFNFVLSTLFGFGSQLNIQRQREQFAQFVQQELYSSAFGKGSREFGWTFTPMPGMDRVQSGVRTTYAVIVVPDDASSIVLETNGCYFPRSEYQPNDFSDTKSEDWNNLNRTSRNCGGRQTKAFVVPIPSATINGSNDFWVDRIDYQPVGKGQRIVVLITGKNFSNQIGVLINGIPLIHSIGMAQPLMRDDSVTGSLTEKEFKDIDIPGRIERVDANKIVFAFKMPKDFEGTPTITLVAPGKAIDMNWLRNISINEDSQATLSSATANACGDPATPGCIPVAAPMFFGDPVRPIRIDSVEVFRGVRRTVNVLVTGAGFLSDPAQQRVFINGVEAMGAFVSKTLLRIENIPAPTDDKIQVTVKAGDKTIKSTAVVNPNQLKIDKVTVISYEPETEKKTGVLVVKIEGGGFPDNFRVTPRKVRVNVTSRTEAFLTIPNPNQTEVVTLTDPVTNISVSTVVARTPLPE